MAMIETRNQGNVMDRFSLASKRVIVTGAGRGIGKTLAREMASAGARVAAVARTGAEIQATAAEVVARGGECIAVTADVTSEDDVVAMVARVVEEWGGLDVIVNNAGGTFFIPVLEIEGRGWDGIVRKNLKSAFLCCREAGRQMIKQGTGGSIINVSSVGGIGPYPDSAPYGAAKAGVNHLTQTLAWEWGKWDIRVNCIAPGVIATEQVLERFARPENQALGEWYLKRTPLRRYGRPEEMATAAIFFASDASSFITGQLVVVGGGIRSLEPEGE